MNATLEAAKLGKSDALKDLTDRFRPLVQVFLERRVGNHVSGQEALDELADMTFARMFSAMQSIPANATLDIFAGRLLKNAQWAVARAQAQAAGFDGTTSTTPSTLIQAMNSERSTGAITFEDEMGRLRALTQTMSEPAQQLLLDRIGGKTFAELEAEYGESPDAIQQKYEEAQAEFRTAMAERAAGADS